MDCAGTISSASSATTFQRRNEWYAWVVVSPATRTSMSPEYFFFVAEASAISRAPKTMSRGTFFSLASTSTSMISSRFPAAMVAAEIFAATPFAAAFVATIPSQFRYQPRPLYVVERERDLLFSIGPPLQLHVHLPDGKQRSEEHTSELQSPDHLVCRLLLEKKNKTHHPLPRAITSSLDSLY